MNLYVNPASALARNTAAWGTAHPSDARIMQRLASTPVAQWFNGAPDTRQQVDRYVTAASAAGCLPVAVAYNIPNRDAGSEYSAGGADDMAAYRHWIDDFSMGIGKRACIVILEPDALAGMDHLSQRKQQLTRLQLIRMSIQSLRENSNATVYLDGGHCAWQPASVMAERLNSAGIDDADGFSLNVSNFQTTADNIRYGADISRRVNGKHYIIDTSRNGNGPLPDNPWCNPDGMAFGQQPTCTTGHPLVDAFLWVKVPGESDGTTGSRQAGTAPPPAGAWWPEYALMLARNSGW